MSWAVKAENLGKEYKQYPSHRDILREMLLRQKRHTVLQALEGVSFEIASGESFGLVGDNGAGKSTLLKIICGTAFPSRGRLEVDGQVAGLLELGAGFHPEFTGRANIYFSGALMGLSREQVREREDEIIAFSELEDFIDQPVKNYSSGMYVRLGFAVATGFHPAILVIDEALAVGDQGFQKKCTDRIMNYHERGTTILFCSHNLYQVRKLCQRALWLDHGRPLALGAADEVVDRYQDEQREAEREQRHGAALAEVDEERGALCRIESCRLLDGQLRPCDSFRHGDTLVLEAEIHFSDRFQGDPGLGFSLLRNDGTILYTTSSGLDGHRLESKGDGLHRARVFFPELPLLAGRYCFTLMATDQHNMQVYDAAEEVAPFTIRHPGAEFGIAKLEHYWE